MTTQHDIMNSVLKSRKGKDDLDVAPFFQMLGTETDEVVGSDLKGRGGMNYFDIATVECSWFVDMRDLDVEKPADYATGTWTLRWFKYDRSGHGPWLYAGFENESDARDMANNLRLKVITYEDMMGLQES